MIKAAIDIGTNSTRLLVADISNSVATDLHREARITRLGQGVDKTRFLTPDAIKRTIDVLYDYKRIAQELGTQDIVVAATSAARDAENATIFIEKAKELTGLQVKILTPEQEAQNSFLGALNCLNNIKIDFDSILVLDIGGGSTELTLGKSGTVPPSISGRLSPITLSFSKDIGSVRLTELFVKNDPPIQEEIDKAADYVKQLFQPVINTINKHQFQLIGTAGTVTTVAALVLGLSDYSIEKVHCSSLSIDSVEATFKHLKTLTIGQRKQIKVIQPGREDVIAMGALILVTLMNMLCVDKMLVSETDILDGLLKT